MQIIHLFIYLFLLYLTTLLQLHRSYDTECNGKTKVNFEWVVIWKRWLCIVTRCSRVYLKILWKLM